jgi:hypothetical protein
VPASLVAPCFVFIVNCGLNLGQHIGRNAFHAVGCLGVFGGFSQNIVFGLSANFKVASGVPGQV